MGNTVYDGRQKSIHDNDLFFIKSSTSPTMASAESCYSDTIDLGSDQVFANIPVSVMFDSTATVSCLSIHSSGLTASKCSVPGFWLQDSADGSTFSDISFVKMPGNTSLDCTAALFGTMTMGVVKIRRYARLKVAFGVGTTGDIRAWLRMGLVKN